MVVITASMVASLRATTGLGMMECKKALVESNGDMRQAEDILRIRSGHKASKLAHRSAKEGLVAASIDQTIGVLVEINCETDFVAKDANFVAFAQQIIKTIQQANPVDIAALHTILTDQGVTVEALRQEAIAKMGENISIRRFVRYKTDHQLASYLHGNKIGVLVDYRGGDAPLGHDIAMHIAACKPLCVDKSDVPAAVLAREKHIYQEQAAQSGKPMDIIDKMVSGRITKFLAEVTLLGQTFVKEQEMTVGDLLRKKQATVNRFAFFAVGEGLESQFECSAMNKIPAYQRILLKLSGEALMGEDSYGINRVMIERIASQIKAVSKLGVQIAIVVGGGNIFRGFSPAATWMDRATADYMGMMATVINALALNDTLLRFDVVSRVQSALAMQQITEPYSRDKAIKHLESGRVVIFAAGTGNPFFTTDTAAALRGVEMKVDIMLKATKVDGVYSHDPKTHPDAICYKTLTFDEVIAHDLKVMDATAFALCRDQKLNMKVFNIFSVGALERVVMGDEEGTLVHYCSIFLN